MGTFDLHRGLVALVLVAHARRIDASCRTDERWNSTTDSCVGDCSDYHDDLVPRVYFDNATGVCVEAVACVTIDPSSGDDRTVIREVRHNVCINVTRVGDLEVLDMSGMATALQADQDGDFARPIPDEAADDQGCECNHGVLDEPSVDARCSCKCSPGWQSPVESQQYQNNTDVWQWCSVRTGAHHSRPELGSGGEDTVDLTGAGSGEAVAGQAVTVAAVLLCGCCLFVWPGCCRRCCCCRRKKDKDPQDSRIKRRIREIVQHANHSHPAPMPTHPAASVAGVTPGHPLPAEFTIVLADGANHTAHVAGCSPTTAAPAPAASRSRPPRPSRPPRSRPARPAPQQQWKLPPPPPPVLPSQLGSAC